MATRYVWSYSSPIEEESIIQPFSGVTVSAGWVCCTSRPTKNASGYYIAAGTTRTFEYAGGGIITGNTNIRVSSYPYIVGPNLTYYYHAEDATDANKGNINYYLTNGTVSGWKILYNEQYYLTINKCELKNSAGTTISYVSSASSSAYPSGGISGSYWYTYLGSDNIDPTAISYPTSTTVGDDITITITPSSSIKYNGTITYVLERSVDGGSYSIWSEKISTTSNITNLSPAGTRRWRVHTKDNYGFESTTYVTGPLLTIYNKLIVSLSVSPIGSGTVSGAGEYNSGTSVTVKATPANGWEFVNWTKNGTTVSTSANYKFTVTSSTTLVANFKQKLKLWVGVNGKARKGTNMWVGVNGKARKIVGAWVGVNGKARRFL